MNATRAVQLLCLAALAIATYQSWTNTIPAEAPTFCDLSQTISCTTVMNSAYGFVFGIPVSHTGIAGFALLLLISMFPPNPARNTILTLGSLLGAGFSTYLTFAEFFILHAICPLCITVFLIIWGISIICISAWKHDVKKTFFAQANGRTETLF